MRWWLAAAFALVAAITAIAVVRVTAARSEDAFRQSAQEFAIGNSFAAAVRLGPVEGSRELAREVERLAQARRVSLYVFDGAGEPVTPARSRGVLFADVPEGEEAVAAALEGRRFVGASADGAAIVVGLPVAAEGGDALVSYSLRPDLRAQLGIVRDEATEAALWATLVGAAVGLLLAAFVGRRLGRIAEAARAIEGGDFGRPLRDRFPDEVGSLSGSIDRMRLRLDTLVTTLREDKNRFEQLVERLHEGVLLVDPDGCLEYANARAYELLPGIKPHQHVGQVLLPDLAAQLGLLLEGEQGSMPVQVAGRDRTLQVSGVPARRPGDGAILVVADVTEREREARAQREFVTNAAHELRTPVAGIVTSIEMLQTGAKDDPEHRDEFLGHIEREAARLARLTRALLVLERAEAREEPPRAEEVSLGDVLTRVAEGLEPGPEVSVAVHCDPELVLSTQPELLEQAVQTIAQNAEKYTDSGQIVISGRRLDREHVSVEVADTGHGIAEDDPDRLFDRFYRGSSGNGGFGLGLAIAAQSVHAIGGMIEIRPNGEQGTVVEIRLPAARGSA